MQNKESQLSDSLLHRAFNLVFNKVGERTKRALIEDLHRQGVFLNDPDLNLPKLANGIREVIGKEATDIIVEQMIITLDELHGKS